MYKLELAKAQAEYEFLLGEVEKKRLMERSRAKRGPYIIQHMIGRLVTKLVRRTGRQ